MNKSENYQNWALEELMSYVKSVAETQTDVCCEDSLKQSTSMNKSENYQNWALEELMNYVKSVAETQTNISCEDLQKQIIPVHNKSIKVEVTAIATEMQQNNCSLIFGETEQIVSSSNLTNLMALIENLHLSNSNLVKRATYLSQLITEFHQDLETYRVQFHQASSKLGKQNQELEASYQIIQAQTKLIEKLTKELAIAKELVAQVQADHNEQFDRLSAEKDNCRDLRTRLNREQQHSLQLKVALEKCLEVPTSDQLADQMVSVNGEDSNFAPKAPPIKPWTTQTKGGGNPIDLSWERQHLSSQNNADNNDFQSIAFSPEYLDPLTNLTIEDEFEQAIAPTDDEMQVTPPVNTQTKSPSPVVYPSRPPKGRKSLAFIELPSFVS